MTDRRPPTRDELHALADQQPLEAERQEELEALVASDADLGRQVADYRRINAAMRELFGPVADEPVPPHLLSGVRPRRRDRLGAAAIAASLVLGLALGGAAGWIGRGAADGVLSPVSSGNASTPAFVAHAVYTPEVLHPVEVGPDQRDHLVKWLSKRLGGSLAAPALDAHGYTLVGGRLLPDQATGPAAQFMYQTEGGERLTVYVRRAVEGNEQTAFRFDRAGELTAFTWIDGPFAYAVVGQLARPALEAVAHDVYRQIAP